MKYLKIVILSLFFAACSGQRSVDRLLVEVWNKDQSVRHKVAELTKTITVDGCIENVDSLRTLIELQQRTDAENLAVVEQLLRNGLPLKLSRDSYKTIWLVVDHAPLAIQEKYLPLVGQMADNGAIGMDEYAVLSDRVAMGQGRPQRYGSQVVQFGTPDMMHLYVYPIENPGVLDSLRASVGLSPMAEYLDQVSITTGLEVQYNPSMTIEQLEKLRNNWRESLDGI